MSMKKSFGLLIGLGLAAATSQAQTTYTWTQTAGGAQNWEDDANWSGAWPTPAAGDTVDFSTVNIAANTTLTLQGDRTAETWKFGDTTGVQTWTVATGNTIVLEGTTPTIHVAQNTATLNNVLDGTAGLTKSGGGALALAGDNTFTGDIAIGGGTLTFSNLNAWGGTGKNVTFTESATLISSLDGYSGGVLDVSAGTATYNGRNTTFSSTTGSGTLVFSTTQQNKLLNLGSASSLTGTLLLKYNGNLNYNGNTAIRFSSLGDAVGSELQFQGGGSDSNQGVTIDFNGTSALTFNNRQVQILARAAGNWELRDNILANNSANAEHTWVIKPDLVYLGGRAGTWGPQGGRRFVLSGTNAGDNEFAGSIPDGVVDGVPFNVWKYGTGTWILSGNNTYSGVTQVTAGTLKANAANALGTGNATVTGGTLVLAAADSQSLSEGARVTISGTGKVQLDAGVKERVGELMLGTVLQDDGIWGASDNQQVLPAFRTTFLTGTGLLYVNTDLPPVGTVIMLK